MDSQFTYDFGIAVSQRVVSNVTKLAGASLTLAGIYSALKDVSQEYVTAIKKNSILFGGMAKSMQAYAKAQQAIISGQTAFAAPDIMDGWNKLAQVGINGAKNFKFFNEAARATNQTFGEFSGTINQAIQGNMSGLVEMGLLTQRATRYFDKFAANTSMRQQAIMKFLQGHKGLAKAMESNFWTIGERWRQLTEIFRAGLRELMGDPKDPNSLYGSIVSSIEYVRKAFARNFENIKRIAWSVGQVLGWVIRQIGKFIVFVGRQVKKTFSFMKGFLDNYQEYTRSFLVWLTFVKVRFVRFLKEYSSELKILLGILLAYKAMKGIFTISNKAILSARLYAEAMQGSYMDMRRGGRAFNRGLKGGGERMIRRRLTADQAEKYAATHGADAIQRVLKPSKKGGGLVDVELYGTRFTQKKGKGMFKTLEIMARASGRKTGMYFFRGLGSIFGKGGIVGKLFMGLISSFSVFKGLFSGGIFKGIMKIFPRIITWASRFLRVGVRAIPVWGWIVAIVVELGILFYKLYKRSQSFRDMIDSIWKTIKSYYNMLWQFVRAIGQFFRLVGLWIRNKIMDAWEFLKKMIDGLGEKVIDGIFGEGSWEKVKTWAKNIWASVKEFFVDKLWGAIGGWFDGLKKKFDWLAGKFKWIGDFFKKAADKEQAEYDKRTGKKSTAKTYNELLKDYMAEARKGKYTKSKEGRASLQANMAAIRAEMQKTDLTQYKKHFEKKKNKEKQPVQETPQPSNPTIPESSDFGGGDYGGGGDTITLQNGAIQIIVQKGENIDEEKLKRIVLKALEDAKKTSNKRAGTI